MSNGSPSLSGCIGREPRGIRRVRHRPVVQPSARRRLDQPTLCMANTGRRPVAAADGGAPSESSWEPCLPPKGKTCVSAAESSRRRGLWGPVASLVTTHWRLQTCSQQADSSPATREGRRRSRGTGIAPAPRWQSFTYAQVGIRTARGHCLRCLLFTSGRRRVLRKADQAVDSHSGAGSRPSASAPGCPPAATTAGAVESQPSYRFGRRRARPLHCVRSGAVADARGGTVATAVRVNLPIAVAMVLVTNPVTVPPLYWAAYELGSQPDWAAWAWDSTRVPAPVVVSRGIGRYGNRLLAPGGCWSWARSSA